MFIFHGKSINKLRIVWIKVKTYDFYQDTYYYYVTYAILISYIYETIKTSHQVYSYYTLSTINVLFQLYIYFFCFKFEWDTNF